MRKLGKLKIKEIFKDLFVDIYKYYIFQNWEQNTIIAITCNIPQPMQIYL